MKIRVKQATYTCPACTKEYEEEGVAQACFKAHLEGFSAKCPPYEVGKKVMTYPLNDSHCGLEEATIVTMKGELWEQKLLVESENGERYWVTPVRYDTVSLKREPDAFNFTEIVV